MQATHKTTTKKELGATNKAKLPRENKITVIWVGNQFYAKLISQALNMGKKYIHIQHRKEKKKIPSNNGLNFWELDLQSRYEQKKKKPYSLQHRILIRKEVAREERKRK